MAVILVGGSVARRRIILTPRAFTSLESDGLKISTY